MDTETNSTLGKVIVVLGEAEWAAIQTVHVAESVAFECWCAANAIADQKVSNTHRHAIRFDIDRITATPWKASFESIPKRETNAMREYLARYVLGNSLPMRCFSRIRALGTADAFAILLGRPKISFYRTVCVCFVFSWPPMLAVV